MGDFTCAEPSEEEKSNQTKTEQPKGILKKKEPSVRFPSIIENDSSSDEEKVEKRNQNSESDKNKRSSSRSSLNSYFQYLPDDGTLKTFSALIVLKMVFFDIAISFGDAVTDIAQGLYLMFDFSTFPWGVKDLTYNYGLMVLVVCWVPGLVAVIHIMSHYRHEYFGLSDKVDDKTKKERRNQFILVILLCLTIYPLVPTISYLINIWYLGFSSSGNYNMKTAKLEMFARVSHSISGCIEAPFQLILTSFLIMLGVLPVPWKEGVGTNGITDGFQNEIPLTSIPMWTLIFSVMDILKCAVMINIFNVYVGQLRDMKTFKRYMNLVGGHLPFFVHAIAFRVLSFTFIILYLNTFAVGPIFLVWFANIIIGYTATPSRKMMKKIVKPIMKMHSIKRREANIPKVEAKKSHSPVWLNSFLSVVVPSCFVDLSDPAIINESEDQKFKNEVFRFNRSFQQKVIGRQIISSTLVILLAVGTICYLVNQPGITYNYNRNIFYNNDFNIFCCVLGAMGFISLLFSRNIDVFESLCLNNSGKVKTVKIRYSTNPPDEPDSKRVEVVTAIEGNPDEISVTERNSYLEENGLLKFCVCIIATLLVLSPVIAGYVLSCYTSEPPTYVVIKNEENAAEEFRLSFLMARVRPLHLASVDSTKTVTGELEFCSTFLDCSDSQLAQRILMIDMTKEVGKTCLGKVQKGDCPALRGVIILEKEEMENKTSRPSELHLPEASFPILSMNFRDARFLSKDLSDSGRTRQFTSILFNDIDGLLTEEEAREEMFEVDCDEDLCTSLKYPQPRGEQLYFGCDGSYKKASRVSIECRNYGLICPEVEAWKEKNQEEKFEKCFETTEENSKYGPIKCKTKTPKACTGEKEFWDRDQEYTCKLKETGATKYVAYSEGCSREGRENYFKCMDDEEKLPGRWGKFTTISPKKDQTCIPADGKVDLRFCRPSQNCVIIEKLMFKCDDQPWEDNYFGNIELCENK